MLKGRSRDPRAPLATPAHLQAVLRARPEPDYEVVEFPGDQYVNAKLQPPPPPPPRPPTGHPAEAGASCGLCGGGGARVRCAACGRRALCASCDDMYHRHPKRRHHQRQALSPSQLRDERPPLPPKAAPPVPPPRRHKVGDRMSASPKPPALDQRRATLNHMSVLMGPHGHGQTPTNQHVSPQHVHAQMPLHLQTKLTSTPTPAHLGSMPFLPTNMHLAAAGASPQGQANTLSHVGMGWNRPRGSLQGFGLHPNMAVQPEAWDNSENTHPGVQNWGRPLRRGASVLELSGGAATACAGCAHCAPAHAHAPASWRYGSCASLDHPWAPAPAWPAACCTPPHPANAHLLQHAHMHASQTPQPYRRADSRAVSRAASRAGSRAASPAVSVRSRTSRRHKHRTPSPPPVPSSDADSESESESDHGPPPVKSQDKEEDALGPAPPPPSSTWQCEHCTFVNEPGVRVCVVCCRTPTTVPRAITQKQDISEHIERLKITSRQSPATARVKEEPRAEQVVEKPSTKTKKERASTGCGPSPPREENNLKKPMNRLVTPTREPSANNRHHVEDHDAQSKHDMGVGPSPPRDAQNGTHARRDMSTDISPPRDTHKTMRVSPYRDNRVSPRVDAPKRHDISVGPSPPRESSISKSLNNSHTSVQKKSTGTSPPRVATERRSAVAGGRASVSNTGTSPPPQSISTQTYEVPTTWERAPSVSRSRPRRRFRDDSRRERSHSRHSLSSDTRESDRSVRTTGPGSRWEWRERDSSPGGDWCEDAGYSRLARRASHLDLRRTRPTRRATYYGSEAPSPERQSTTRAISLEALAGAGARREAERGMELAQLMGEAEKLGFSAAEVQAALTQSPAAPLAWLRERWPSLCAGVRAAAARLAPTAAITELEARAALARHRGAMWPAVTECVERHRRQNEVISVGEEGRLRGHVWGSPVGADDDAAPPRSPSRHSHRMREDSSDEFEAPTPHKFQDDDWMYLPLNIKINEYEREASNFEIQNIENKTKENKDDIAKKIKLLLEEAGVPSVEEDVLLKGLLSGNAIIGPGTDTNTNLKPQPVDLIQSENDFIDAYNALTRSSPLPNINDDNSQNIVTKTESKPLSSNETQILNNIEIANINKFNNNVKIQGKQITKKEQIDFLLNDKHQIDKSLVNADNKIAQQVESREDQMGQLEVNLSNHFIQQIVTNEHNLDNKTSQRVMLHDEHTPVNLSNENTYATTSQEQQINHTAVKSNNHLTQTIPNGNQTEPVTVNLNYKPQQVVQQTDIQPLILEKDTITKPAEEKSNNLSDMVDNTQRLIQQMKEEINSDINSIDGRTVSQSEIETSSEETNDEQESSYSETEEGTDNLTSDEKEFTSSEDEDSEDEQFDKQQDMEQRASSEDNEHFEEALDHVETQLEDFKNANIEMLDSIARTLQEEHIYIVEPNKPRTENTSMSSKKQDLNNNLFITVNSFEEIYEELNGKNNKDNFQIEAPQKSENVTKQKIMNLPAKETIIYSTIETLTPLKIVISENKTPAFKANLATIEEKISVSETAQINIESVVVTASESMPQGQNDIRNKNQSVFNDITFCIENTENNHADQVIEETEDNNTTFNSNLNLTSNLKQVETNNTDDIGIELSFTILQTEPDNTNRIIPPDIINQNKSNDDIVEPIQIDTKANEISDKDKSPPPNNQTSKMPGKEIPVKINGNNISKNSVTNKSSIPKLIKTVPNNKTKLDKTSPKLIVSKVPIRRTSIKQYPAPAPPKTHFGNIQSGHVRQLQTRLFNNKETSSTPVPTPSEITEVKPSTSTLNKKKQAPLPPTKSEEKQMSPPKISSPPKDKKQYFRETCRTEDEWTDSESDDSQIQIIRPREESERLPPSPPPPLTLRRVSGHLIDLAKIRLPEGSPERQARMLLAEGATETWEQAQLAVELISRGAEPPAALVAALECADLTSALAYLYQDCELCASRLPEHEMVSMLRCTHRCCRECAHLYFTVQITERSIADCVCPYCKLPELENLPEDAWLEYFAHLDILLKTLLEVDVHELFQRKLRDRTLARDPNFRWCMECSSGFFVHPKQKKIRCPECRSISCAACRKPWTANHEGLTCEQYTAWLEDNDPERSVTAIQQHLRDNGLECPRCHFKYSLSRGGCMHFTCTQCKYEFCYGCGKPFTMGARCGLSEYCAKLGLHAHHPRNCLFYLRDKEPHELQTLLQMNNVNYEKEPAEGSTGRCPVQLQRETPTGLVDGTCGSEAPPNSAGLCKGHYVEYLAGLARGLDPIPIMDVPELVAELRRRALPLPERGPWDTDPIYAGMCAEIVREKIPLD